MNELARNSIRVMYSCLAGTAPAVKLVVEKHMFHLLLESLWMLLHNDRICASHVHCPPISSLNTSRNLSSKIPLPYPPGSHIVAAQVHFDWSICAGGSSPSPLEHLHPRRCVSHDGPTSNFSVMNLVIHGHS